MRKFQSARPSQERRCALTLDPNFPELKSVVSVVSQVERKFHIRLSHEELEKLATVGDVLDLLDVKLNPPTAAA